MTRHLEPCSFRLMLSEFEALGQVSGESTDQSRHDGHRYETLSGFAKAMAPLTSTISLTETESVDFIVFVKSRGLEPLYPLYCEPVSSEEELHYTESHNALVLSGPRRKVA
jgi:hypothetical protein